MARLKEYDREARKRKRKSVIYIVCEGMRTEPIYFKSFKSRQRNVEVYPCHSQYTNASSLVAKAKTALAHGHEYHPEYGDTMWCVFDRDANSNAELQRAKEIADSNWKVSTTRLKYPNESAMVIEMMNISLP